MKRFQRDRWLYGGILLSLAIAPFFGRLTDRYRGIVLEVTDAKAFVATESQAPRWRRVPEVESGQIAEKQLGWWSPRVSDPGEGDGPLLKLHRRYNDAYEGEITQIRSPLAPGLASVAVVETPEGTREVPLWGKHLATAAVGKRLRKHPKSWEPELLDIGATPK